MKSTTIAALFLIAATPAQARDENKDNPRVPLVTALSDCRAVAENQARLACFDRAAAQFDEAERRGELFVTDRAEIQKSKRSLFGLNLPSFSLFKGKGKDESELREIESTIDSASYGNLKWTFVLADGARWRQTEPLSILDPRHGAKALIRRGAVGSYFIRINGTPSGRVERVN